MSVLATVRPDAWNFPLFVHVLGAMILVAGLVTGAAALFFARGDAKLLRLGFWSLMLVSFPGWIIMRLGAQWIYSKEGWDNVPDSLVPRWLNIGYLAADAGGLVLVITLIIGGTNQSEIHWDIVKDLRPGGQILLDGEVVQQDGVWLI